MRVRMNRQTSETRRRGGPLRRPHLRTRDDKAAPAAGREAREEDDLADERRLRASGGPDDRAQYTCGCGYVWEADVSASVTCPHCGASQAW
jgi:rubrerythrin